MNEDTISGVISTAVAGFTDQLWLIAPIGLGVMLILWGVPKGVGFLKRLSK